MGIPIYSILVYKYFHYIITDKRVIIQKGLVGRDFEIADLDKITNTELNIDIFDKFSGEDSGSIIISTAGSFTYTRDGLSQKPYTLSHIEKPYEVFRFLKKLLNKTKKTID